MLHMQRCILHPLIWWMQNIYGRITNIAFSQRKQYVRMQSTSYEVLQPPTANMWRRVVEWNKQLWIHFWANHKLHWCRLVHSQGCTLPLVCPSVWMVDIGVRAPFLRYMIVWWCVDIGIVDIQYIRAIPTPLSKRIMCMGGSAYLFYILKIRDSLFHLNWKHSIACDWIRFWLLFLMK